MIGREPFETTNLDSYGNPALPWSRPRDLLAAGATQPETPYFLGTVRPDGRPHTVPIGPVNVEGGLYFTSGLGTRKARNLAVNPACTLSVRLEGIDLVLDGTASQVADRTLLEKIAAYYREAGWEAEMDGDALTAPYSAPSAGPAPWHVFQFAYHTAIAVAHLEPYGATRWRFRH